MFKGPYLVDFVVTLPQLISQWEQQIKKMTKPGTFRIIKYTANSDDCPTAFKRTDPIFADNPANMHTIILTSPRVLANRQGPKCATNWATETNQPDLIKICKDIAKGIKPNNWPYDLGGKVRLCIVDEAVIVKNIKSRQYLAVKWLEAQFYLLATGTPDMNRIDDLRALISLMEPTRDQIEGFESQHNVETFTFDPYNGIAGDNDPVHQYLRCTLKYANKYIFKDSLKAELKGDKLTDLLQSVMIRRSFVSVVNGKKVGADMPPLKSRIIEAEFTIPEHEEYDRASAEPLEKLLHWDKKQGKVFWNFEAVRQLLLLALWTGFEHIQHLFKTKSKKKEDTTSQELTEDEDQFDCFHILSYDDRLYRILTAYCATNRNVEKPKKHDICAQLRIVLKGAPKLRELLMVVSSLLILRKEKLLLFCSGPGMMIFIEAVISACRITTRLLHAKMSGDDRDKVVAEWNMKPEPMVLLTTMNVGSLGLNLQEDCHYVMFTDPCVNQATWGQCTGRLLRNGQKYPVEAITLTTKATFNDNQLTSNAEKIRPFVIALMDRTHVELDMVEGALGQRQFEIADYVEDDEGRLYKADSAEVLGKGYRKLSPEELMRRFSLVAMGNKISRVNAVGRVITPRQAQVSQARHTSTR